MQLNIYSHYLIPKFLFHFFQCYQRPRVAAKICSILWKNCCPLCSCSFSLSISLHLDGDGHTVVLQFEKLCKIFSPSSQSKWESHSCLYSTLIITCFLFQWWQLPEEGQKWGFLIWLIFSYCGLFCIACMAGGKVCTLSVLLFRHLCESYTYVSNQT